MAFRNKGTIATKGNGVSGSVTPGTPTGAVAGDILILISSQDGGGATTYTWPSGFTQFNDTGIASPDGQAGACAWKRAAGSDSLVTSRSTTTGSWVVQCFAWSGRHASNSPVESTVASNTSSNASPTTLTANGVTAVAGDDLVWIGWLDTTVASASNTFTPPTGYANTDVTVDGVDNFDVFAVGTKDNASAGATGTVSGTLTHSGSAGWIAALIRIPAAAGGSAFDIPQLGMTGVGF